jgi:hypothetical protein
MFSSQPLCIADIDTCRFNSFYLTARIRNSCSYFNASARTLRLLHKIKLIIAEKRRALLVQMNICTALIMFVYSAPYWLVLMLSFQLPESRTFTIQLLGKDDVREDDSPAIIDRWNHYMESYQKVTISYMRFLSILTCRRLAQDTTTDSIPGKGKLPFLRRYVTHA